MTKSRHLRQLSLYVSAVTIVQWLLLAGCTVRVQSPDAYDRLGRYQDALVAYQEAARQTPDDVEIYVNMGIAYGELKSYTQAIGAFKRAIQLQPNDADAHYNLGLAYQFAGRKQLARDECRILKSIDSKRADELADLIK